MTIIFLSIIGVCVLFWRAIRFALAGAIWLVNGGRLSMARCEDTARGIMGAFVAILFLVAMLGVAF